MITDKHIEIINECLPYIEIGKWQLRKLNDPKTRVFEHFEKDELVGFGAVKDSCILFLGVKKENRCQGIGTSILRKCEEYVKSEGYKSIRVSGLTIGVPTSISEFGYTYDLSKIKEGIDDKAHKYFKGQGYKSAWKDEDPFDMDMDLSDLESDYKLGDTIGLYSYVRAKEDELEKVKECVGSASKEFVKYYDSDHYFKGNDSIILCAKTKDGEFAGALIVSTHDEEEKIGSIGCMAVSPKFRHQGIATVLSIVGTNYLKSIGLKKSFLSFTHSGLERIYEKTGYKISIMYFMATKKF